MYGNHSGYILYVPVDFNVDFKSIEMFIKIAIARGTFYVYLWILTLVIQSIATTRVHITVPTDFNETWTEFIVAGGKGAFCMYQ